MVTKSLLKFIISKLKVANFARIFLYADYEVSALPIIVLKRAKKERRYSIGVDGKMEDF